jgi:hypothetical protein
VTTGSDTIEMGAPARTSAASGDEGAHAHGSDRPTSLLPDPGRKELDALARRMHAHHPHVSLATLTALVEEAHADLAGSPVQSFRMILTERAVRRRLSSRPTQA